MPFASRDGVRLFWKSEGLDDRPPLLLLNSIGTDLSLWDAAVPYLLPHFRVVRMDMRGHGASDVPQGDYTLNELAMDAAAVLDAAGLSQAYVAGVSLGGMVAMELALTTPERVSALALICTSAEMERDSWQARVEKVKSEGTQAIADLVVGRFLSPQFRETHPVAAATLRRAFVEMEDDGYAGAAAAIRDMSLIGRTSGIHAATLVITGRRDVSTPFAEHGVRIVDEIAGAKSVELDCAHLPPIEVPASLASTLIRFYLADEGLEAAQAEVLVAGMANRRRVLGDAWVDRSLQNRTTFNADFQDFMTRVAWHDIWARPGLDEQTRRLLVVAITAALGRWEEFRLHVRAGLDRGGFTADELKEVLMQLAVYAGVPAANTGFTEAAEILAAIDKH